MAPSDQPPSWHPDSGGYSPAGPPPPPVKRQIGTRAKVAIGVAAVVVLVIVISAIAGGSDDKSDDTSAVATSTTSAVAETTRAEAPIPTTTTATTTTAAPTSAAAPPIQRTTTPKPAGCESVPSQYATLINGSFKDGYMLTNTSAFTAGGVTYIAGEIVRPDGAIRSRDDVFAVKGGAITPVTTTARTQSTLPDLRRVLDVSVTDDGAQTAMDCARTY